MRKQWLAVALTASVWVLLLPGLVIWQRSDSPLPPLRPVPLIILGAAALGVGFALVWAGAGRLSASGVSPFGTLPGPVLVTAGPYRLVRNPMDLGSTLMALGPAAAFAVPAMMAVPLAALLYFAIGRGPIENRYLEVVFGAEYTVYRAAVPMWLPRFW